jgi:hypothetical protein
MYAAYVRTVQVVSSQPTPCRKSLSPEMGEPYLVRGSVRLGAIEGLKKGFARPNAVVFGD